MAKISINFMNYFKHEPKYHIYAYIYIYVHTYMHIHAYMYSCMYVCIYVYEYECMHAYMWLLFHSIQLPYTFNLNNEAFHEIMYLLWRDVY